jgi:hypothetical protein
MAKRVSKKTSLINSRFMKVVEIIIRKNAECGLKPDSERSLSVIIGPDPTAINKIHRGERNATPQQIANLGNYFNLDLNYFFRNLPIRYEVYNDDKIFLPEKKEELVIRMKDRFNEEVERMEHVILIFREELQKLEKHKASPVTVRQAKKVLVAGRADLVNAFSKALKN